MRDGARRLVEAGDTGQCLEEVERGRNRPGPRHRGPGPTTRRLARTDRPPRGMRSRPCRPPDSGLERARQVVGRVPVVGELGGMAVAVAWRSPPASARRPSGDASAHPAGDRRTRLPAGGRGGTRSARLRPSGRVPGPADRRFRATPRTAPARPLPRPPRSARVRPLDRPRTRHAGTPGSRRRGSRRVPGARRGGSRAARSGRRRRRPPQFLGEEGVAAGARVDRFDEATRQGLFPRRRGHRPAAIAGRDLDATLVE